MIDGINVLTQSPVEEPSFALIVIAALVTMTICLIIFLSIDLDGSAAGLITGLLMVLVGAITAEVTMEPTGRYEYECTISEDASLVEVLDQYEFVEQRGDIYVLRDKEE